MTGLFAKAIRAVTDALQRAIRFEELIGFVSQLGPEHIAVSLLLCHVGDIATQHVSGCHCLPCMLGVGLRQSVAEMKQRVIVPPPLGRNMLVNAGVRCVALRLFRTGRAGRSRGDRRRGFFRSGVTWGFHDAVYDNLTTLLRGDWQMVFGSCLSRSAVSNPAKFCLTIANKCGA